MVMRRMRTAVLLHQCDNGTRAALLDLEEIYSIVVSVAIHVSRLLVYDSLQLMPHWFSYANRAAYTVRLYVVLPVKSSAQLKRYVRPLHGSLLSV